MNDTTYPDFKVKWEIDVSARSPREAARMALAIQRDPGSTATIFEVEYRKKIATKSGKKRIKVRRDIIYIEA